ncbi:NAD(P)-dependent oxidoreductase [Actinoplanes derwentensis]|uniref:Putative NADH-flavin reductase n=1 Tax=Actinoplanes derwentensis TaxID=113562 RepID=A0A1H2CRQ3_9ACTN|nr:NAD(P)H-binding protein [Actinoplanes derwentensis]GID89848.1 NmrA family transcriptional regulator [Actinoplanes derwentensis]SDT72957.1 Putative NADH-flavin reductase [Actinoplanes derwentensis]
MSKIVVVAATGGIGRHLLNQSLAAGHEVTAVVRNPQRLGSTPARVVRCDLALPQAGLLEDAVAGADAVLSALGAPTAAETGVASIGTRAVVEAMTATGVRRLIVVSAASVGTVASPGRPDPPRHNPGDGVVMRHLIAPVAKKLFRRHYLDLAVMEDILRDSDLAWTVSRPPRLLETRLRRRYRTAFDVNVRSAMFISRADVASHMLAMIDDPSTVHRTVSIAY